MSLPDLNEKIMLKTLSRKQRRVLGVLLEKAFTVPDQYPMTLKATTTGCNQKNNRDPVSNYSEDDVEQTLDEIQKLGFVGRLQTESGRTDRFRHYMRHRMSLTEPQLAILTELMLRGRQQLGELRTRASRMVAIESQEQLRAELQGLIDLELVRANGRLERRGVEVDHNLYPPGENREQLSVLEEDDEAPEVANPSSTTFATAPTTSRSSFTAPSPSSGNVSPDRIAALETLVRELKDDLSSVRDELRTVLDRFEDLRRQLGG